MKEFFISTLIAIQSLLGIGGQPAVEQPQELAVGATVFKSVQVGASPQNNYYLKTDGTNSTWAPVAGGGGSGGGTWATTTSNVANQLINYSLNDTDIVTIGNSATTSAEFYYDPNTFNFFVKSASSTIAGPLDILGNFRLPALTQGFAGIGSGGRLYPIATSSIILSELGGAVTDAQVPDTITVNLAGTATALAANGANCSAGSLAAGVDASGAAEGCTDVWTESENTSAAYISDGNTNWDNSYGFTTFAWPFTPVSAGVVATTSQINMNGFLSVSSSTIVGNATTTGSMYVGALNLAGEYISNFTTYVRGLFTGGDHITITAGDIDVDDDFLLNTGDTGTGTYDFSGATMKQHKYPSFTYATSTAWTGTTTIPLGPAYNAQSWNGVKCFTDAGTLNVSFYDGTNRMDMFNASTTVGTVSLSSNNTFTAGEKRYVDIGTPASSPTKISCTLDYIDNN